MTLLGLPETHIFLITFFIVESKGSKTKIIDENINLSCCCVRRKLQNYCYSNLQGWFRLSIGLNKGLDKYYLFIYKVLQY